ncbi:MAG: LLM class flavin-dependent oxidoreductase [Thermoleophilia bacterium]
MGVIESVRGVLWARRNQPDDVAYVLGASHERFAPADLVRHAVLAEEAGFDGIAASDHLTPWWEPGEPSPAYCGNAWVWLGAAGQATRSISIGTGVTGLVWRYNPVVVAQQLATLESLFPGRAYLGAGSSEAMNEVPAGMSWPDTAEQLARTTESLEIITRLLDGETVTYTGEFFRTRRARLYLTPPRRPPVYLSAFHEDMAEVAGRLCDGIWTLADPTSAGPVLAAYRRGCEDAGREPGEVILQSLASVAGTDDEALETSREWKATLPGELYTDDIHEPRDIQAKADDVSDRTFTTANLISADPDSHVRKLKLMRELGATAIVIVNASGASPEAMIGLYGSEVLPRMRD